MAEAASTYFLTPIVRVWRALRGRWSVRRRIPWLRARHLRLGQYGEDVACRLLEEEGADVLCRNFRHGHQELDIVAREEDGTLCFIEVKTRRWREGVAPAEAVDDDKRRQLCLAARAYMRRIGWQQGRCRFDIVEVLMTADGNLMATRRIRSAFDFLTS